MNITKEELKDWVATMYDEYTLLDYLGITMYQLVDAFEEQIMEKKAEFEREMEELGEDYEG